MVYQTLLLIDLLKCIHDIGNQGENQFSSVSKVSEASSLDVMHPTQGLKRDLIRLIANLSCKNKPNQDKVLSQYLSHFEFMNATSFMIVNCNHMNALSFVQSSLK